jgi:O-acetyl-ADP-ribose deacetylase (regulator of RNase III)
VYRVRVVEADIATLEVDAVVNAASEYLLGGGGVDGAIHDAAGPELVAACRAIPEVHGRVRCPTGESRITPGFRLPARWVIHTVGPVWRGGSFREAQLLASCYASSLALAAEHDVRSIAFPAISCGAFRYPVHQACGIAVRAIEAALKEDGRLERVVLVAFEPRMREIWELALSAAKRA